MPITLATRYSFFSTWITEPVTMILAPVSWPTFTASSGLTAPREAQLLLVEDLLQVGAIHEVEVRLGRQLGEEQVGHLRAQILRTALVETQQRDRVHRLLSGFFSPVVPPSFVRFLLITSRLHRRVIARCRRVVPRT